MVFLYACSCCIIYYRKNDYILSVIGFVLSIIKGIPIFGKFLIRKVFITTFANTWWNYICIGFTQLKNWISYLKLYLLITYVDKLTLNEYNTNIYLISFIHHQGKMIACWILHTTLIKASHVNFCLLFTSLLVIERTWFFAFPLPA
jgi:hypothetical protein